MPIKLCISALVGLLWAHGAHADIDYRVGAGAGCNYSSIQTAINNAVPSNGITNILIARNQAYNTQRLTITGKNVRLIGGYADCNQVARDSVRTLINGSGGGDRSIVNVDGSTSVVAFYNLHFQNGHEETNSASYAGAIDINTGPHNLVYLENVEISNSSAGWGGAMSIRNSNSSNIAAVNVVFGNDTYIHGNTGVYGAGGIFCRDATLTIKGGDTSIQFNNALGSSSASPPVYADGGGLYVDDCVVKIGGFSDGAGILDANVASRNGGGMYASGSRTVVDLYNIHPDFPTVIKNNTAAGFGGGIDIEEGARVRMWDGVLWGNIARGGGAAVALYDAGGANHSLFWASRYFTADTPNGDPAAYDRAYNCTNFWECNILRENRAVTTAGASAPGGALRLSGDDNGSVDAVLVGTRVYRNEGTSAMEVKYFSNSFAKLTMNGAVVDANTASGNLIYAESNTRVEITNSTLAGNTIGATRIINRAASSCPTNSSLPGVWVYGSIIWQPGTYFTPGIGQAGCVRYNTISNLDNVPTVDQQFNSVGNPLFVDPANGNYRLQPASPALDYGPAAVSAVTNDGGLRVIDLPFATNAWGPQDSGAYERLLDFDVIFVSGFDSN
jgi:hypothetical protein